MDAHHSERFVREPERRLITGISRTGWWALERERKAPGRVKLRKGGRAVGWRLSDLRAWVDAVSAGREWEPPKPQEPRGEAA